PWTCRICDHFFMSTQWSIIIKTATHHARQHDTKKPCTTTTSCENTEPHKSVKSATTSGTGNADNANNSNSQQTGNPPTNKPPTTHATTTRSQTMSNFKFDNHGELPTGLTKITNTTGHDILISPYPRFGTSNYFAVRISI